MAWILLLLLGSASAAAQAHFQLYTTDNGLPNNSVLALHQSKDAYLWFTTYRGIVRFDGVHFQVFDTSNTPAIRGTTFAAFSLMEDRHGALWAGSWNGGAIRYQDGVFRAITTKDGLPNNQVVRIDEDEQGTIWIFTNPGLCRFRNGKVEVIRSIDGESIEPYLQPPRNLGIDPYLLGLWRFGHSGLQRFAYGKWSDVPLPKSLHNPAAVQIDSLLEDSQRRLWFGIAGRPRESFCVQDRRLTVFKGLPKGAFANYQDRLGRLWITDHQGHTALWQAGRITPLDGVSTNSTFAVLEDSEGSFWVGTLNQGLAHATRQVIRTITLPGGAQANAISSVTQDAAGDIWVGSYGLTRIHAGHFQNYLQRRPHASWHAAQGANSLWADRDGSIFVGRPSGLDIFRQGKFELPGQALQQIRSEVTAILRDHTGDLWLGTDEGLYRYRDGRLKLFSAANGIRGQVRAIYEDKTGTLWAGTDAVLCKEQSEAFACFGPSDPLSHWQVRSITADAENVLWVTTSDKGLLRIAGDAFRWIGLKDGLPADDAAGILQDSHGYFWISSQLGIYRVKKQELNELAQGRIQRVTSILFKKGDGLNDANCSGHGPPHGIVAKDGTLWFPTTNGLATIDPKNIPFNNSPPRIQIEGCLLEQREISCVSGVSLPPDANEFEIKYTALNLVRSDEIQFKYWLHGLDKTWVAAGTQRIAYYSHLMPGTYRFSVIAANSDGVWNPVGKELQVTVAPHYYQTLWFQSLCAGVVIGGFLLLWRIRATEHAKSAAQQRAFAQQIIESQESERKRIAAELHDSLGQRLAVIKNMALLASRPGTRDAHGQIETIAAETSQAIQEVRQISHDLRPYQLDLLGLTKAIEVLTNQACEAAGIRSDTVLDDLCGVFEKKAEIHFYRVVQECLSNAVKHSKATLVQVQAHRTAHSVALVVSDNGIGFTPGETNGNGRIGGFGLTGIVERAQLLGGQATIQSSPGQGTSITVEIRQGKRQ